MPLHICCIMLISAWPINQSNCNPWTLRFPQLQKSRSRIRFPNPNPNLNFNQSQNPKVTDPGSVVSTQLNPFSHFQHRALHRLSFRSRVTQNMGPESPCPYSSECMLLLTRMLKLPQTTTVNACNDYITRFIIVTLLFICQWTWPCLPSILQHF